MNAPFEKRPTEAADIKTLCDCLVALLNRPATEADIRTIFRELGIAAVAQSTLTPILREQRESFDGSPVAQLNRLIDLLPNELTAGIAKVADSFVRDKVHSRFDAIRSADRESHQKLAAAENEIAAKNDELYGMECNNHALQQQLEYAANDLQAMTLRHAESERENAVLTGRLLELETQLKTAQQALQTTKPKRGNASDRSRRTNQKAKSTHNDSESKQVTAA